MLDILHLLQMPGEELLHVHVYRFQQADKPNFGSPSTLHELRTTSALLPDG